MGFWNRYLIVVLLCIAAPFGVALYADTHSELDRVSTAGNLSARVAPRALVAQITLEAHRLTGNALTTAQQIAAENLLADVANPKAQKRMSSFKRATGLLDLDSPAGGFSWGVDETGAVLAKNGQAEPEDRPAIIAGHPLFMATQEGYALDGFWRQGNTLFLVGAAPISIDGEARGAVLYGRPIDRELLEQLGGQVGSSITLVGADKDVLVTTLPEAIAASIVEGYGDSLEPKLGGRLVDALPGAIVLGGPLLVDSAANGLAYTSIVADAPGQEDVRWLISVPTAAVLRDLARRQEYILGFFLAALLASLAIGLVLMRAYVSPIDVIAAHLAELQQGRGDRELAEVRVSRPFRRLVRLINMIVQKLPTRTGYGDDSQALGSISMPPPSLSQEVAAGAAAEAALLDGFEAQRVPAQARLSEPPEEKLEREVAPPRAPTPTQPAAAVLASEPPPSPPMNDPFAAPPATEKTPVPASLTPAVAKSTSKTTRSASEIRGVSAKEIRGVPAAAIAAPAAPSAAPQLGALPVPSLVPGDKQPVPPPSSMSMIFDAMDSSELEAALAPGNPFAQAGAAPAAASERPTPPPKAAPPPPAAPPAKPTGARMGGSLGDGALGSAGLSDYFGTEDTGGFRSEATVVAAPDSKLLAKSAREYTSAGVPSMRQSDPPPDDYDDDAPKPGDATLVYTTPKDLIAKTASGATEGGNGLDPTEHAHFKETYERFVDMRKQCGEPTADLAFDRFVAKLKKNRDGLIKKYNCKTVRFQVYQKDGKAALKATPVRESEARR